MNEQDTTHPGSEVASMPEHGTAVRLDQGHVVGDGGLPERFTNPGLPAHVARMADLDEAAARRAEKQVSTLFGISIVGTLLFIVFYFAISLETTVFVPGIGVTSASNLALGVTLALALLGIGFGAVHWAKTLMPDEEIVEERHTLRASDESRDRVVDEIEGGGASSQITRRPMIKYTLGGALGLFAVPLVLQVAGSLGPMPQNSLSQTFWNGGPSGPGQDPTFVPLRLMRDPENTPIKAEDVTIGSVFHVMPEGLLPNPITGEGGTPNLLEEKAKAAVLLMRLDEDDHRVPEAEGLGLPRHRRLLQDLHPRRLPGRPVRAADAPPALPVPPVDLRRDAGRQGDLRPGQAPAAAAADHRRRRGLPRLGRSVPGSGRPELLGAWLMSTDTSARPATPLRDGDTPAVDAPSGAARKIGGVAGWVDDRTGAAKPVGYLMKKVFPDHWSFMLGEIAMYSMIVCLLTGAFLTFWFVPSAGHTVYDGSFVPLRGVSMSEAYASTLNISFDIKGGLIIRQIHHWAALMFIVALIGAHVPRLLHRRVPQAP